MNYNYLKVNDFQDSQHSCFQTNKSNTRTTEFMDFPQSKTTNETPAKGRGF